MNSLNAAIGVAAAAFSVRTQATVGGMTTATGKYISQEATSAGDMDAITGVTVV